MAAKNTTFAKGDWLVHTYYGIGQIKSIEKKQIDDEKLKYFKVQTANSIFFVPVENIDAERVRAISSQYKLNKAIKILKSPAELFEEDHTLRKRQLSASMMDSSIENTAQIVRDLTNHRTIKNLNDHEDKALEKLSYQLAQEWSLTQNIDIEAAQKKLFDTLEAEKEVEK